MKYEIRTNCEYVLELDADSEAEALEQAERIPLEEWDHAWAPWTAEPLEETPGPRRGR